jgi:ubiquinone/menaquinone biosynthesis C-methylase UbiE
MFAEIPKGSVVLDLGCGAGLDSLIAADRTGPEGCVVGVDFSFPMLSRARRSAVEAGMVNVVFCQADAEKLPLRDDSVTVVLVNGIFNLNVARQSIFRELGRVVRRGGVVYAAELILKQPLAAEEQASESNWFA